MFQMLPDIEMDVGFNLIDEAHGSKEEYEKIENSISLIAFLRKVRKKELKKAEEVRITGLTQFLYKSEDWKEAGSYVREVLLEHVNYLNRISPVIQLEVKGVLEEWGNIPKLTYRAKEFEMNRIFGSMVQKEEGYFWQEINISS